MTSRVSHTSVDARNAYTQSLFWAEVLGYTENPADPNEPGHEECLLYSPDGRHRILFIEVPETKTVKNRLHFDLRPTDLSQAAEVERLLGLGARVHADLRHDDVGWVTMLDPEGNEFCVLRSELEVGDPLALDPA
ncbi:MAG TPA: VOC family protein [Candidatus Ruania gallistercoris]|uniref:VOC family protein n=1 Tax=Candidatus Ruania gallistercoris TaxID=2838746 RepID=A0A9D2J6C4_9MICO|nr:VOC family protein [Candidatus Ruania gallistercoris]